MTSHLATVDWICWVVILLLHQLLIALLLIHRLYRRLLYFTFYAGICFVSNVVCFCLAINASPLAAAYANYVSGIFAYSALAGFVWREVYLVTFGPRRSLPDEIPARVFFWITGFYAAVLVTTAGPSPWLTLTLPILGMIERAMLGAICASIIVILTYSFMTGISWRKHTLALAIGVALSSTIEMTGLYLGPHASRSAAMLLRESTTGAYLISLALWLWAVTHVEKQEPITPEMLDTIQQHFTEMQNAAFLYLDQPIKPEVHHT